MWVMLRTCFLCLVLMLSACVSDFENTYQIPHRKTQGTITGGFVSRGFSRVWPQLVSTNASSFALGYGMISGHLVAEAIDSDLVRNYRLNDVGAKVIQYGDNTTIVLPSDYFFYPDSADLRYEREFTLLEIVSYIAKIPGSPVTIMAFSDSVGSDEYTKELTEKQSHSILSFLWSHGIDRKRLHAIGYGKYPTIADNQTVLGNGLNRRVEIHWRKIA